MNISQYRSAFRKHRIELFLYEHLSYVRMMVIVSLLLIFGIFGTSTHTIAHELLGVTLALWLLICSAAIYTYTSPNRAHDAYYQFILLQKNNLQKKLIKESSLFDPVSSEDFRLANHAERSLCIQGMSLHQEELDMIEQEIALLDNELDKELSLLKR
ncbi:MAG: YqiJ family protein [Candidatus Pacebacteria bacterium]|nr:YqiJ family protein [Candidatus Paceibacterota bacterium]MCD8507886.1 YqiJ family protein [Candidatus Paceibacterota bacterium]MCD8527975.1 YqiJ family protein [Candidatus Paceibacterota bacterium]MCD8563547.1 YqiJ family protein [Candidatus Paceibacterota bacterium]